MAIERTLSIIKPDAVAKNKIGAIYSRFEDAGLRIIAAKMLHPTKKQAESFYAVHRERPFYASLVAYMSSGPVMVQLLEGENAVALNRELMGATNPSEAAPGTIRADFAESIEANAVHGSDAPETAREEIAFFFGPGEILPPHAGLIEIPAMEPTNLLGLNRAGLEHFFEELGEKRFRAEQVLKWIHQYGLDDFERMSNLSRPLRARLGEVATVRAPAIEAHQVASDGTEKWSVRVDRGNCIEMVFIPEPERGTLCISSQVGCPLNCSFCATARQGFNRNLSAAEIIGQLWLADRLVSGALPAPQRRGRRISNVVLMGMGEPLLNFEAVAEAIDLMLDDCAYGVARRRVTLSTAGVVPGIDRLAERIPVSLAVSLHASTDELRDRLVPINRKYPIRELLEACRRYARSSPTPGITFEYVMLAGINDSVADAERLARLLGDLPAKVNLIPFNPFPDVRYERSSAAVIDRFREILIRRGLMTITRRPRGDDIDAACGQLAGQVQARGRRPPAAQRSPASSTA